MTYIVMIRSAHVRGRARNYGPYKHAALVEVAPGYGPDREPAMISTRARGVLRVLQDTPALYAGGKTPRSEFVRQVAALRAEAARLNAEAAGPAEIEMIEMKCAYCEEAATRMAVYVDGHGDELAAGVPLCAWHTAPCQHPADPHASWSREEVVA